ncbi:MAG: hypothetical protein ACK44W_11570 [Planctomycetota bacterium]
MRPYAGIALSALLLGGLLYGALAAVERGAGRDGDPWLGAWQAAGLRAQLQTVDAEPARTLLFADAQPLFEAPALQRTALRRDIVGGATIQGAVLSSRECLPEIPEGRHFGFRLRPEGSAIHLTRTGRHLLLARTGGMWVPFLGPVRAPRETLERIFAVFEEEARRRERP